MYEDLWGDLLKLPGLACCSLWLGVSCDMVLSGLKIHETELAVSILGRDQLRSAVLEYGEIRLPAVRVRCCIGRHLQILSEWGNSCAASKSSFLASPEPEQRVCVQSQARSGGAGEVQAQRRPLTTRLQIFKLFMVAKLDLHLFTWSQRHWRPADGNLEPGMVYNQEPITHRYPHGAAALLAGVVRM